MCQQFHGVHGVQGDDSPQRPLGGPRLRRTNSFSDWESLHNVWTAAEVIKAAGYPLEQHTVTTSDGYILRMERLPRHGIALLLSRAPKNQTIHAAQPSTKSQAAFQPHAALIHSSEGLRTDTSVFMVHIMLHIVKVSITLLPTWPACSAEFDVTNVNRLGAFKSQE